MWKGSLTRSTRRSPRARSHSATAVIDAVVVRPSLCATHGLLGHAVRHQVAAADHRLAGGVAAADAAGDHDERREPLAVEAERVVEPGPQHRRGAPVVLRGAQHDDGVHRPALVLLAHHQHHDQRHGVDDGRRRAAASPAPGAGRRSAARRRPSEVERFAVLRQDRRRARLPRGGSPPWPPRARRLAVHHERAPDGAAEPAHPGAELVPVGVGRVAADGLHLGAARGTPGRGCARPPRRSWIRRPSVCSAWKPTKRTRFRWSPMPWARWCRIRPDSAMPARRDDDRRARAAALSALESATSRT